MPRQDPPIEHRFTGKPGPGRPKGRKAGFAATVRAFLAKKLPPSTMADLKKSGVPTGTGTWNDILIANVVKIALKGQKESDKVKATEVIWDRAHGKPVQAIEQSGDVTVRVIQDGAFETGPVEEEGEEESENGAGKTEQAGDG